MSQDLKITAKFLKPFYSMAKAFEMAEVPLLFMSGSDRVAYLDEVAQVLGGTVVYSSQPDFEKQVHASLTKFDYLFVAIDQSLTRAAFQLVLAYLEFRDVMGANPARLRRLDVNPPADEHRLALITDRTTFETHDPGSQRALAKLCTRIAVS
jgi:hypothetical protein